MATDDNIFDFDRIRVRKPEKTAAHPVRSRKARNHQNIQKDPTAKVRFWLLISIIPCLLCIWIPLAIIPFGCWFALYLMKIYRV